MSINIFEAWAAAEAVAETNADLPKLVNAAFHASRREALTAAALLRTLAHTGKLEHLLDELNALASPAAPHASLAASTLHALASESAKLREPLEAAQLLWLEQTDPLGAFATLSPAELLLKIGRRTEAECKAVLKRCEDALFAAEVHRVLREDLRSKTARLVRRGVSTVGHLANAGVRLELVPELERLIKNKGTEDLQDSAAEALLAVARSSAPLSLDEALTASKRAAGTWTHAQGLASLEHWGRAGQLQDHIADVAATHPLALKLHVIATANAEAFALLPDDLTAAAVVKAPSLFPTLIARDLATLGALSPGTQRVSMNLAPHQFIGDEATAWLVSRSEDASGAIFVGGWRAWANEIYTYEIAIRVLARAGEHPQADAARAHLETLLSKEPGVSKIAAQALATLAALRKDEALLARLLGQLQRSFALRRSLAAARPCV